MLVHQIVKLHSKPLPKCCTRLRAKKNKKLPGPWMADWLVPRCALDVT